MPKAKLVIECEVDVDVLEWVGPRPSDDIVADFNAYYQEVATDAFELALMDPQFSVTNVTLTRIDD